ncbi:transporter [Reichenbachiella versicolor]|uniref:transporter n=1 Tax=Reichenbachiella versicolor TaxID=1821036 RepID=UPI0013A5402C|nr:transporter [Reichenbachiella versicolor]
MKTLSIILLIILLPFQSAAQSCCSGGVPISNNLGLPLSDAKTWQIFLSYDFNLLNTLQDGNNKLDNNTRKRITHTALTQFGYSFNKKFSADILIPYVRQEREITPIGQPSSFNSSNGIGDIVFLSKYSFFRSYQLGIGVKLPTGSTTEINDRGLTLNADMQPGSGSWDIIYWLSLQENLKSRPSTTLSLVTTYRSTGSNNEYFDTQTYEFGNEFQMTLGIADQLIIGKLITTPSLGLRYRTVDSDQVENNNVPSTGGNWLFFRPGIGWNILPEMIFSSVADIPVYAYVEGTQVTPTMRLNFSIIYTFQTQKL